MTRPALIDTPDGRAAVAEIFRAAHKRRLAAGSGTTTTTPGRRPAAGSNTEVEAA